MDSRDLIVLGLVGVGGWLAWRWYKRQPVTNAQQTAPDMQAGLNASSMTADAARTTVFGGGSLARRLLDPIVSFTTAPVGVAAPTAPIGVALKFGAPTYDRMQTRVLSAVLAPQVGAPSPSGTHYISTGIAAPLPTQPSGDQPSPGDPSPLMGVFLQRGIG